MFLVEDMVELSQLLGQLLWNHGFILAQIPTFLDENHIETTFLPQKTLEAWNPEGFQFVMRVPLVTLW